MTSNGYSRTVSKVFSRQTVSVKFIVIWTTHCTESGLRRSRPGVSFNVGKLHELFILYTIEILDFPGYLVTQGKIYHPPRSMF